MRVLGGAFLLFLAACGGCSNPDELKQDAGTDAGLACETGTTECDGVCVSLISDKLNCGHCGNACGVGRICAEGNCMRECGVGETACGNYCVDTFTDVLNCGGCNNVCTAGATCVNGACQCPEPANQLYCSGLCPDVRTDPTNCGACGATCQQGFQCESRSCVITCNDGETRCTPVSCANLNDEAANCGQCGRACPNTGVCINGNCLCGAGLTLCGTAPNWSCANIYTDTNNCGACGTVCPGGQTCENGLCELPCPSGQTRCGTQCVNTQTDLTSCGMCQQSCVGGEYCDGGACAACESATTDCDGDGWKVSEGDCCDQVGGCASDPKLVNPGAFELPSNNLDDNCNGLVDTADVLDTQPCDSALDGGAWDAGDYAKALGICRTTTLNPPTPQDRTWGLLSVQLLKVDGTLLDSDEAASIRSHFGNAYLPQEGSALAVISSGIAADATQTNPGPNGGPSFEPSGTHGFGTLENIQSCTLPYCIKDWFVSSNPPLKNANQLPAAPGCASSVTGASEAQDSVMLVLRLRAPTNARAFTFKGLFVSSEYPEYVCTEFNDQLVALVTTPGNSPVPVPNPPDLNLMTYSQGGKKWPIGINVAKGTDLFKACEAPGTNAACFDQNVSSLSCSDGAAALSGTGYEAPFSGDCPQGGASRWLSTTGNVVPGQIVELRIGIWDVGDSALDSTALLDGFRWLTNPRQAGTD